MEKLLTDSYFVRNVIVNTKTRINTNVSTITVNALAKGNTTITIASEQSVDYKDISKTIELTVEEANYSVNGVYYTTLADAYLGITEDEGIIIVEQDNVDNSEFTVES